MADKETPTKNVYFQKFSGGSRASGGAVYGLGFVGAIFYYIQAADTFWMFVLGILKALLWPAFLVYELLGFVGA